MLAFLVRRTKNASGFSPPGPIFTRTDFTVTPAIPRIRIWCSVLIQRFLQHRNRLDDPVPVHLPILSQRRNPLLKRQCLQHCNSLSLFFLNLIKKKLQKKQITCYKQRVCTVNIYLNNKNKKLYSKIVQNFRESYHIPFKYISVDLSHTPLLMMVLKFSCQLSTSYVLGSFGRRGLVP